MPRTVGRPPATGGRLRGAAVERPGSPRPSPYGLEDGVGGGDEIGQGHGRGQLVVAEAGDGTLVGGEEVVGQVAVLVGRFGEHVADGDSGAVANADLHHGQGEVVGFQGAVPIGDRGAGCMGSVMVPSSLMRTLTRA